MAETIRDVTIRVSLKSGAVDFKPPNLQPTVQAFDALGKSEREAMTQAQKHFEQMGSDMAGIRAGVDSLTKATLDSATAGKAAAEAEAKHSDALSTLEADMARAKKALEDRLQALQDGVAADRKAADEALKHAKQLEELAKAEKAAERAQREHEKAERDYAAAQRSVTDNNLKAAESFKAAGEGAFTLARGIALVTASSDDDLAKMLKRIAAVQGSFDLFKGSVDTIKGVVEGVRAMRAVSDAAAKGNAILAASNVAVGATAKGAAGGMTALNAAMGPVGIIALAIGASAVGVVAYLRALRDESPDAADGMAELASETDKYAQSLAALNAARAAELSKADRRSHIPGAGVGEIGVLEKELELLTKQQRELTALRDAESAKARTRLEPLSLESLDKEGREAVNQARAMRQENLRAEGRKNAAAAQQEIVAAAQREFDLNVQRLGILERMGEARRNELEDQRRAVEQSREALRVEEDRLRSERARLGLLSEADVARVRNLSQTVQDGGQLGREQLLFLNQVGDEGTRQFVEQQASQRAQQQGLGNLFGAFGGGTGGLQDSVIEARAEVNRQIAVEGSETEIVDKLRELENRRANTNQQMVHVLNASLQRLEQAETEILRLQQRVEQ